MKEKKGHIIILVIIILTVICGSFSLIIWYPPIRDKVIYHSDFIAGLWDQYTGYTNVKEQQKELEESKHSLYDATEKINLAMEQYSLKEQAELISGVDTIVNAISLNFEGMASPTVMNTILELLKRYNGKAYFFLPAIQAAEYDKIVTQIKEAGHEIGSNTLNQEEQIEKFTKEEMIGNFCRSENILEILSNEKITLLKCNNTEYTNSVLSAAKASGYEQVVAGENYINFQSFTSYEMTLDYISHLKRGSILSIKLNGVLSDMEYKREITKQPAIDKPASISLEEGQNQEQLTEEERLLQVVEWVLRALEETKFNFVLADNLKDIEVKEDEEFFVSIQRKNQSALAPIISKINTKEQSVVLSFRGISDETMLNRVIEFLEENEIKASFFVTGEDILKHRPLIEKLIKHKFHIGNAGMSEIDLTQLSAIDIIKEIYYCNSLLKSNFNIDSKFFMPYGGKYNDEVLEAASSLGYQVVTYSKNAITEITKSPEKIMEYFVNGYSPGDIIYFQLNNYDKLDIVLEYLYKDITKKGMDVVGFKNFYFRSIE